MNYQEALRYIHQIQAEFPSEYTLDKVLKLCEYMGRPDRRLRIIHIAGTNGKGSVGAFLSDALAMCGYTVGRFVSPVLFDERESIQRVTGGHFGVDTAWISEEEKAQGMTEIAGAVRRMQENGYGHPTSFEIETVLAFHQMVKWHVDIAVIEAGLGGRLDATNIIERPVLTVFTRIATDHTAVLGNTLEEIAGQKFGIVKAGVPVVSVKQEFVVMEKLKGLCQRRGVSLGIADPDKILHREYSLTGTRFSYQGGRFRLKQLGVYQPENAILALEALSRLARGGFHKINSSSIQTALEQTKWHGRFELICKNPFLIVDGAHNPSGADVLRQSLLRYFPSERFTFIFGVFADKDYQGILQKLLPLAKRMYTVKAPGARGMDAQELAQKVTELLQERPVAVTGCRSVAAALQEITRKGEREKIVVSGSLSFLADVYRYFDMARYI